MVILVAVSGQLPVNEGLDEARREVEQRKRKECAWRVVQPSCLRLYTTACSAACEALVKLERSSRNLPVMHPTSE